MGETMQYITIYASPLGDILLAADALALTGLWFEGGKYYARSLGAEYMEKETPVLKQTRRWLDRYFSGKAPGAAPPLHMAGTPFQKEVWEILRSVPYGQTVTYAQIAKEFAAGRGMERMAARAVGGAVGRNPISIIVPCHRVVGTDGSLTGYAGGIDRKRWLLELEGAVGFENI